MKPQATRVLKNITYRRWYVISNGGKVWPTWAENADHAASRARQHVEPCGQSIANVVPAPAPSDDVFPLADHWHRIVAEEVSAA